MGEVPLLGVPYKVWRVLQPPVQSLHPVLYEKGHDREKNRNEVYYTAC